MTLLAGLLLLCACQRYDGPPKDEGPLPSAHDGTYVSDYGSLRFNGDGESIELEVSDELAQAIGLPRGKISGSYAFLIDNPKGLYRYDRASIFRLYIQDTAYELRMPVGVTTEEQIVFYAEGLNDGKELRFTRQK